MILKNIGDKQVVREINFNHAPKIKYILKLINRKLEVTESIKKELESDKFFLSSTNIFNEAENYSEKKDDILFKRTFHEPIQFNYKNMPFFKLLEEKSKITKTFNLKLL